MKEAFLEKFFKPERNQFDNGTQTSSVLPLAFGLAAPFLKPSNKRIKHEQLDNN